MNTNYSKINSKLFLILLLLSNLILCSSWDYNKGGEDWPESCKTPDQSPIDLSHPFEYRSNLFN